MNYLSTQNFSKIEKITISTKLFLTIVKKTIKYIGFKKKKKCKYGMDAILDLFLKTLNY